MSAISKANIPPHMLAGMTGKQILFALHLVNNGGKKELAAQQAGYGKGAHTRANELGRNEKVLELIKHLGGQHQLASGIRAMHIIEELAEASTPADSTRLKAAGMMLATSGLGPVVKTQTDINVTGQLQIEHEHQMTVDKAIEELKRLGAWRSDAEPIVIEHNPNEKMNP
jgi:phage terminase small subunit